MLEKEEMHKEKVTDASFIILSEGFPYIIVSIIIGFCFLFFSGFLNLNILLLVWLFGILGAALIIFGIFCMFFFRNPKIKITEGEGLILSPCNGTILEIAEKENEIIIYTFLSIFNVHIQRSPVNGTVKSVEHKDGKFLAAWNPEAHIQNEQNILTIGSEVGIFVVRQIAGFLARRCVSKVKAGDLLKAGSIIGLIKFSSQVDLHVPKSVHITVKPGDKVKAGITVMGKLIG